MGFYSKIAFSNIKKNARFYVPRIITEAGLLGCLFIIITLTNDQRVRTLKGGVFISEMMIIGVVVNIILSLILMFYTNSFLMKQRTREFGLYNILGMEKRHVGRVLFAESAFSSLVSLISGLALGTLFYKLCSLLICKIMDEEIMLGMDYFKIKNVAWSLALFIAIDIITFIWNRIRIGFMKPVDLLHSANHGEKEPKVKWPLLVIGLLALGVGYYLALSTDNPVTAFVVFFIAAILVIIGTYFLYVAGSIWILKILKKNKNYYYTKKHMPAVSGLLYRMKQNAVGLASITILSTMVLIMISSTMSLYVGLSQTLDDNYPDDLYLYANYSYGDENWISVPQTELRSFVKKAEDETGIKIENIREERYFNMGVLYEDGVVNTDEKDVGLDYSGVCFMTLLSAQEYEKQTGISLDLADDEIAVYCDKKDYFSAGHMLYGDTDYKIAEELTQYAFRGNSVSSVTCAEIVVANEEVLNKMFDYQKEVFGEDAAYFQDRIVVNYENQDEILDRGKEITKSVDKSFQDYMKAHLAPDGAEASRIMMMESYWEAREAVYGLYGSMLFLGIILGFIFIFATALIIYYKQISEGYEDRGRFQIMEKIGMSSKEVKKAIRSQILLVFFLPLIVAAIHTAVAFPILEKLLHLLLLSSTWLFFACTVAVFVVFVLVYTFIYKMTAKTYYKIVH